MAATEEPTMIQAASGHAPSEHVDTHDADDTEKEKDIKPEVADRESERAPMRRSRRTNTQEVSEQPAHKDEVRAQEDMDVVRDDELASAGQMDSHDGGDEGVTRCVCGSTDENLGLMIQCETCKSWQHCACMGMHTEEDCPDVYYCEQCRPENHIDLLRSLGFLSSNKIVKRGSSRGGGRHVFSKESAQELREARDAIRAMALDNAARLRGDAVPPRERRSGATGRSSPEWRATPKRRTMNSRDFGEDGWEPIPPELLRDEAVGMDDESEDSRKRKRHMEQSEESSESVSVNSHPSELSKRRRMQQLPESPRKDRRSDEAKREPVGTERTRKERGGVASRDADIKPKHPNQYTYRNRQEAASAADVESAKGSAAIVSTEPAGPATAASGPWGTNGATAGVSSARSMSPNRANGSTSSSTNGVSSSASTSSTSSATNSQMPLSAVPSRTREGRRAATRAENASRSGTPSQENAGRGTAQNNTLPEHLAHLAYLLPPSADDETDTERPQLSCAPKKGMPEPFQYVTAVDPAIRIRFPQKRMTMGEMRKRVRTTGEYVTRIQLEAVEREKRVGFLASVGLSSSTSTSTPEQKDDHISELPLSMQLVDQLTRDLTSFQRRFGHNAMISRSDEVSDI